jgi:hypothetical protein
MDNPDEDPEIASIRGRPAMLEAERSELFSRLETLERRRLVTVSSPWQLGHAATASGAVTAASPAAEKIALFRRRFAGRPEVFSVRWENVRTKRSGYAPACANEWIKGICEKPRVKCGECPNQALPFSDAVIARHLTACPGLVIDLAHRQCRIGDALPHEDDFLSLDGHTDAPHAGKLTQVTERPNAALAAIVDWSPPVVHSGLRSGGRRFYCPADMPCSG